MKDLKVQKFRQYLILEGDTPENYMEDSLSRIKKKLDPLFDDSVKKMKDFKNFNLSRSGGLTSIVPGGNCRYPTKRDKTVS